MFFPIILAMQTVLGQAPFNLANAMYGMAYSLDQAFDDDRLFPVMSGIVFDQANSSNIDLSTMMYFAEDSFDFFQEYYVILFENYYKNLNSITNDTLENIYDSLDNLKDICDYELEQNITDAARAIYTQIDIDTSSFFRTNTSYPEISTPEGYSANMTIDENIFPESLELNYTQFGMNNSMELLEHIAELATTFLNMTKILYLDLPSNITDPTTPDDEELEKRTAVSDAGANVDPITVDELELMTNAFKKNNWFVRATRAIAKISGKDYVREGTVILSLAAVSSIAKFALHSSAGVGLSDGFKTFDTVFSWLVKKGYPLEVSARSIEIMQIVRALSIAKQAQTLVPLGVDANTIASIAHLYDSKANGEAFTDATITQKISAVFRKFNPADNNLLGEQGSVLRNAAAQFITGIQNIPSTNPDTHYVEFLANTALTDIKNILNGIESSTMDVDTISKYKTYLRRKLTGISAFNNFVPSEGQEQDILNGSDVEQTLDNIKDQASGTIAFEQDEFESPLVALSNSIDRLVVIHKSLHPNIALNKAPNDPENSSETYDEQGFVAENLENFRADMNDDDFATEMTIFATHVSRCGKNNNGKTVYEDAYSGMADSVSEITANAKKRPGLDIVVETINTIKTNTARLSRTITKRYVRRTPIKYRQ